MLLLLVLLVVERVDMDKEGNCRHSLPHKGDTIHTHMPITLTALEAESLMTMVAGSLGELLDVLELKRTPGFFVTFQGQEQGGDASDQRYRWSTLEGWEVHIVEIASTVERKR